MHFELQKLASGRSAARRSQSRRRRRAANGRRSRSVPDARRSESGAPATGRSGGPPQGGQGGPPRTEPPRILAARDSGMSRSDSYGTLSVRVQPVGRSDHDRRRAMGHALGCDAPYGRSPAGHASRRNSQGWLRAVHLRGDGQGRRCHTAQRQPQWWTVSRTNLRRASPKRASRLRARRRGLTNDD